MGVALPCPKSVQHLPNSEKIGYIIPKFGSPRRKSGDVIHPKVLFQGQRGQFWVECRVLSGTYLGPGWKAMHLCPTIEAKVND